MLTSARIIIVSTLLLTFNLAIVAADRPTLKTNPLDGMQFRGQTGEQGKESHHEDTITFKNGQFRSLDCEEWGFGPSPYSYIKEGETYHFSATLPSTDRGTLEWKGTIIDDIAEASFRWLHKRWYWSIDRRYWFKGRLQNAQ